MITKAIELIDAERAEQLEKHKFDTENDDRYENNELIKSALFCLAPSVFEYPYQWSEQYREKILAKKEGPRAVVAGALIAAHVDRMINTQKAEAEFLLNNLRQIGDPCGAIPLIEEVLANTPFPGKEIDRIEGDLPF